MRESSLGDVSHSEFQSECSAVAIAWRVLRSLQSLKPTLVSGRSPHRKGAEPPRTRAAVIGPRVPGLRGEMIAKTLSRSGRT